MLLGDLLKGIEVQDFAGDLGIEIAGLAYDSRKVKPGYLFVALRGSTLDGHDFVEDAVRRGAMAIVTDRPCGTGQKPSHIQVSDSREVLSKLAVRFYGEPFSKVNLIGITGTNGKTTTSYLLESILKASGGRPGVVGTINYRFGDKNWKASVTTPESLDLMRALKEMADAGATDVVIEVSSHALDQGRVRDCPFRVAVFTNLSRDHLDYHGSMDAYFEAKSRLFKGLDERRPDRAARAVINADDPRGEALIRMTDAHAVTYGLSRGAQVRATQWEATRSGLSARVVSPVGEFELRSSLMGGVNIYNILAAVSAAICMDISPEHIVSGIAQLKHVPGRLEAVENDQGLTIVVDYAHTPDALLKVFESLKPLVEGRLITVFGCGGDRDKGKRREMGRIAAGLSDLVFITSDNPRTEDPSAIASQIEQGVVEQGMKRLMGTNVEGMSSRGYVLELDRKEAIFAAIRAAKQGDLVLIAGKGHEDYQIIGDRVRHFDDREVAREALAYLCGMPEAM